MKQFRTTIKQLEATCNFINRHSNHKVSVCGTCGCGTYLTIDGKEYKKLLVKETKRSGIETYIGLTNKQCRELLQPLWEEAYENYKPYMVQLANQINEARLSVMKG